MKRWFFCLFMLACSTPEQKLQECQLASPVVGECDEPGTKRVYRFENASIVEVMETASRATCKAFVLDEYLRKIHLTIIAPEPLSADEFMHVFQESLRENNIALTLRDGIYRVYDPLRPDLTSRFPASEPTGPGAIEKTGDYTYRIKKNELSGEQLAEIKMIPSLTNGQMSGFKLYAIRNGSLWSKLGFQNGDTLQSINQKQITSLEETLTFFTSADALEVTVLRKKEPLTLHYTFF